ncbi:hypothetical protein HI914_07278 [Erysiphe necator]|nr:hypothetical protein HI914_07278 [Erysiphe necator]
MSFCSTSKPIKYSDGIITIIFTLRYRPSRNFKNLKMSMSLRNPTNFDNNLTNESGTRMASTK